MRFEKNETGFSKNIFETDRNFTGCAALANNFNDLNQQRRNYISSSTGYPYEVCAVLLQS